jgi:hypothetical protein
MWREQLLKVEFGVVSFFGVNGTLDREQDIFFVVREEQPFTVLHVSWQKHCILIEVH